MFLIFLYVYGSQNSDNSKVRGAGMSGIGKSACEQLTSDKIVVLLGGKKKDLSSLITFHESC